jgi:hypothetical protein
LPWHWCSLWDRCMCSLHLSELECQCW